MRSIPTGSIGSRCKALFGHRASRRPCAKVSDALRRARAAIKAKGGIDSLYAVDYAARVARELGADVIKLNEPVWKAADARTKYVAAQVAPRASVKRRALGD